MIASSTSRRKRARDRAADERAGDRWRRHPAEQPPVDPARADVGDRGGRRRDARDADVRARARRRGCRDEHNHWQADVPEHETHEAAGEGDREAPDSQEHRLDVDRPMLGTL